MTETPDRAARIPDLAREGTDETSHTRRADPAQTPLGRDVTAPRGPPGGAVTRDRAADHESSRDAPAVPQTQRPGHPDRAAAPPRRAQSPAGAEGPPLPAQLRQVPSSPLPKTASAQAAGTLTPDLDPSCGSGVRVRPETPAGGAHPSRGSTAAATSVLPAGSTGRSWTIELPAGLKLLSLNQRLHWAEQNRRAQVLKKAAWVMALNAKVPRLERVIITAEHQPPPDGRHRDGDNYAPSAKAATDGIVAAGCLSGDDKRYVAGTFCTIGEPYPLGRLVLHIAEVAAEAPAGAS